MIWRGAGAKPRQDELRLAAVEHSPALEQACTVGCGKLLDLSTAVRRARQPCQPAAHGSDEVADQCNRARLVLEHSYQDRGLARILAGNDTSQENPHGGGHRHGRRQQLGDQAGLVEFALPAGDEGIGIAAALTACGLTASNSEAFRMNKAGAVRIDGEKVSDRELSLAAGFEGVLQVGKRRFARLKLRSKGRESQ